MILELIGDRLVGLEGLEVRQLQWTGYALLADEQEVGKHQDSCEQGQYKDMSREEAIQGTLSD